MSRGVTGRQVLPDFGHKNPEGFMSKACSRCGGAGPFHKNKASADGLHPQCKACRHETYLNRQTVSIAGARKRYAEKKVAVAQHERTPKRRAIRAAASARYRSKNKDKVWARQQLASAVRGKRLERQACERCGSSKAQGHHHDYAQPLVVRWLCATCHGATHRVEI